MGKSIIQVGLAILSALNVAGPLVFDAQSMFPNWPWQYHALIGFIVFALVMIWMVIDKSSIISKLLDAKPSITVEPIKEGDIYLLKVTNTGE